ncbi:GH22146 [Drosophila grimshawi]|uniref:GH22146 n=1 Tax=Drosophila grimshawi TaxID=7222 RepID=B4J4M4_DROGR|nr:GH22146 [Drosophila grimshawi]
MCQLLKTQLRQRIALIWMLQLLCNRIEALTVDNQLVSARNDCFERIALEAMLPFEKTFRTEDTNSLKMCKEKCLQAGEKCQAISFGVHRRGNGTCQLSSEQYGNAGGASGRPGGVIFDPDFDLYARKTNCFDLSDNSIGAPSSPISTGVTPVNLPNRPLDVGNTPVLVVDPTPHTDHPDHHLPPSPLPPPGPSLPPPGVGDRLYFSHEIYPLYKYPTLYEHNYPAPNEEVYIPGGYAANVPEVDERYRPSYGHSLDNDGVRPTPHSPPRPIFGLGYGNGYSYGTPERYAPTTLRPGASDRPSYAPRPEYSSDRPDYPRPSPARPYDSSTPTGHGPRPTSTYDGHREPRPDYTNRPDPPQHAAHDGSYEPGPGSSARPPVYDRPSPPPRDDYVRRNGSVMRPNGYSGYDDDKTISTYFNPGDYMHGNKKPPMQMPGDRDHDRYPMDEMNGK